MLEQHHVHIYTSLKQEENMAFWKQTSKLETIIWTFVLPKIEFPSKNELDYQIKPLKPVFFFNNLMVSCTSYFVFSCLDYRGL